MTDRQRLGSWVIRLLAIGLALTALARMTPASAQTWPIESLQALSPSPIVLTGNTTEALAGHGFGAGQLVHARWHAVYWEQESLSLVRIDKVRLEEGRFDWAAPLNKSVRATPEVPGKPMMLIRLQWHNETLATTLPAQAAGVLRLQPPDGVVLNELLREGLSKPFSLLGKSWTLKTQVLKNAKGRLLPGSVELQLAGADGKSVVVLGRAPGHIFKEQRLMWAGDLNGDGLPDFYLRRVLVTGHIDHIMSLSAGGPRYMTAGITVDPDQAESRFTSGVGEMEEKESAFANSPSLYPEVIIPSAVQADRPNAPPMRYALSGVMPLQRYGLVTEQMLKPFLDTTEASPVEAAPLPGTAQAVAMSLPMNRVLKDMRFEFEGESYRILVESAETYAGSDVGYQSNIAFGEYEGRGVALQVSIYHRGQRQVLLVTSPGMEGGMGLSAGDLDGSGKLSITIDYYPHYNNGMTYTWRRSDKPAQLFQRTLVYQSQGC